MKTCHFCGNVCSDDYKFCNRCGRPLDTDGSSSDSGNYKGGGQNAYYSRNSGYSAPGNFSGYGWECRTNPYAIASLVLGIIGLVFMCAKFTGFIPSILAIIFGFVASSRISSSGGREKGGGMATAGITLGIIAVSLSVIALIFAALVGISFFSAIFG